MIPVNWKLRLPPRHFGLLMPLNQQAKMGVTVLIEVTDPDYQEEIGLLPHNVGKEEYVWDTGDPIEFLLVLPCAVMENHINPTLAGLLMAQTLQE